MKKTGFIVLALLFSLMGMAQEDKDGFSDFVKEQQDEFDQFTKDINEEFINFMRKPWKELEAKKPIQKRVKPEPVKPVVYDEKTAPKNPEPVCLNIEEILDMTSTEGKQKPVVQVNDVGDITFEKPKVIVKKKKEPTVITIVERVIEKPAVEPEKKPAEKPVVKPEKKPVGVVVEPEKIVDQPQPTVEPQPVQQPVSVPESKQPEIVPNQSSPLYAGGTGRDKIVYVGQSFYLSNALNRQCKLNGLNENSIADAYESLYRADSKSLLEDCMRIKQDLQLNDWGIFTLLKQVADTYCATANESTVMQQFLLNEMGYKARTARMGNGNKLLLFVATDCQIYAHPYITLNGQQYFNINGTQACQFYMCQKDSPRAKNSLGMRLNVAPNFSGSIATSTHQAKGSSARVTAEVPKRLMDFYKSYPQCDYGVYAKAPVNKDVEGRILASLAPCIQGKSEVEAANILINFVQTAFQYATDDEQFGYEKPFFVEELFYYPFCDCEDRSVLYSYLVKKLMGLDVVFLDYPNHIATAVRFNENVNGDYLMVDGQRYTVCDPTYIGASIGRTMPQFKNVSAKVLRY